MRALVIYSVIIIEQSYGTSRNILVTFEHSLKLQSPEGLCNLCTYIYSIAYNYQATRRTYVTHLKECHNVSHTIRDSLSFRYAQYKSATSVSLLGSVTIQLDPT